MSESFERLPREEPELHNIESREKPGEYLYHMAPKEQRGEMLMPLNELKNQHPDLYEKAVAKYAGREKLMERQIPVLKVKWNDVLHLTVVHPSEVKQAIVDAGIEPPEMEWYKIPKSAINPENTVVYSGVSIGDVVSEEAISAYNEGDLPGYASLPDTTKQYYKEEIAQGRKPLLFHGVPHILYRGKIDTAALDKVKV